MKEDEKMRDAQIVALADEAGALDAEIKAKLARLVEIRELVLKEANLRPKEHTAGKKGGKHWIYDGTTTQIMVTFAGPSLAPTAEALKQISKIAGTAFAKLFDKETVYSPVKGFRDIATAVLTPARARKVIALAEKANAPKVAFKPLE